jgi:outer membrane lipoprotein SlyB
VLELVELVCPTDRVAIETDPIERSGEASSAGGDAVAIGSTAALGTVLGAIFGGGKNAAIGAAAGGAVGAGGTLGAKGKPAAVKSEAVLMFRLRAPATVTVLQEREPQP